MRERERERERERATEREREKEREGPDRQIEKDRHTGRDVGRRGKRDRY